MHTGAEQRRNQPPLVDGPVLGGQLHHLTQECLKTLGERWVHSLGQMAEGEKRVAAGCFLVAALQASLGRVQSLFPPS